VLSSPVTFLNRPRIADFALKHRLPMICARRKYALSGCLMSYSPILAELFRRVATYVNRILKGAKPADIPVGSRRRLSWSSISRPRRPSA
jgi:putative ABC transport system substrate-binding protein